MSLTRLALRIAAARALNGATLAEGRVFDSAVDPIDLKIRENRAPILVVTTDDHEVVTEGRDVWSGEAACDLVIEAAIASRVSVGGADGAGGQTTIAIPHTDEGMEIVLDLIERQVLHTLMNEGSEWSRLWMLIVPRITRRLSRRGAASDDGVRYAARQIVLTCDHISDPLPGASTALGTVWGDLLVAMEADAALGGIADVIRAEIEGTPLTDWQRAAQLLGVPLASVEALGIVPTVDANGNPVAIGEVIVADPARLDISLTEAAATEQGV